jgi:small subunit ribosomal protein S18
MKVKTRSFTKTKGKLRADKKKRDFGLVPRKRFCRFCVDKVQSIDYKDMKRMEAFITERGKILSSRISGNCAKHQRWIAEALKKARFISLIPYVRQ